MRRRRIVASIVTLKRAGGRCKPVVRTCEWTSEQPYPMSGRLTPRYRS